MGHANYFELTGGQKFGLQGLVQRKHEVSQSFGLDVVVDSKAVD